MPENYDIVPWFNSQEWHKVYEELSSENSNKDDALNLLEMWKARCPSLPSGIESTLSLLQVHVQDIKTRDDVSNEQTLRLAYSSAIMRFVNHMLDAETAKGLSLYSAAKNAGVPDWIVELRHDAAHSHNIPSINLLRNACTICLEWLREHYWEHLRTQGIHDYCNDIDENKIATMIYFCSCISICAHSRIKKITDITETKMLNGIINDAKVLFSDYNDSLNYETLTITTIIDLMNSNAKRVFKDSGSSYYVNKALIDDQSLILSLELLDYLSEKEFNEKNKLNKSLVSSFEVLLTFLHTHDLILDFIMALVKITQTESCQKRSKLAALWISEILVALKKSKQFLERARKINSTSAALNRKKDLKQLYHHWFPNEKHDGLVLDLQKPVPMQLTDISFIQPIISSYSPYVIYFVKDFINLLDPRLPKQVCDRICILAKLISTPENFPADLSSLKIYTIEDIHSETMMEEDNDINKSGANESITELSGGIWKIASNHYNWRSCPIGKLPQTESLDKEME